MARVITRRLRTFLGLPGFVIAWLVPIWAMLGLAKAAISTISFKTLAPRLGVADGAAAYCLLLSSEHEARARLIGQAIRLVARYTPWNSNCFPQAIVARCLLGVYGIPCLLYFGVRQEPDSTLKAHAWVAAGRVAVTGGVSFSQFTVAGVFRASRRPRPERNRPRSRSLRADRPSALRHAADIAEESVRPT